MLQCPNCKNEQELGKFCGKCGTTLVEKEVEALPSEQEEVHMKEPVIHTEVVREQTEKMQPEQPVQQETSHTETQQSPVNVDQVKDSATKYWDMFKMTLKNPTKAFEMSESQFSFGLTNLILYTLSITLALFFTISTQMKGYYELPFFDVNFRLFFLYIVLFAVVTVTLFAIEKIFIKRMSLTLLISQFGGLFTPLIVLNIVALVLGLVSSIDGAILLMFLSMLSSIVIMPAFFMYEKTGQYGVGNQRVYIGFITIIAVLLVVSIVSGLIFDSYVDKLMNELELQYFMF